MKEELTIVCHYNREKANPFTKSLLVEVEDDPQMRILRCKDKSTAILLSSPLLSWDVEVNRNIITSIVNVYPRFKKEKPTLKEMIDLSVKHGYFQTRKMAVNIIQKPILARNPTAKPSQLLLAKEWIEEISEHSKLTLLVKQCCLESIQKLRQYITLFNKPSDKADFWLDLLRSDETQFALDHDGGIPEPCPSHVRNLIISVSKLRKTARYGHTIERIITSSDDFEGRSNNDFIIKRPCETSLQYLIVKKAMEISTSLANLMKEMNHAKILTIHHRTALDYQQHDYIGVRYYREHGSDVILISCLQHRIDELSQQLGCAAIHHSSLTEPLSKNKSLLGRVLIVSDAHHLTETEMLHVLSWAKQSQFTMIKLYGRLNSSPQSNLLSGNPFVDLTKFLYPNGKRICPESYPTLTGISTKNMLTTYLLPSSKEKHLIGRSSVFHLPIINKW